MSRITRVVVGAAAVAIALCAPKAAAAQNIFSGVGGVCLNVEGGVIEGARIIGWFCSGAANEKFIVQNGTIKLQGTNFCVASDGRAQGAQLRLRTCNGDVSTQNFAFWSGSRIGHNTGYCVDLSGSGWFGQNNGGGKPAVLWSCHGARNQQWFAGGALRPRLALSSLRVGDKVTLVGKPGVWTWNGSALIGNDGSTLVGNDGASLVAAGGGNLISVVSGSLVAAGGGNLVAAGGGNVVGSP